MLFTHFGVSGPLVLTLSSVLATADWPQVQVTLNLKPALTPEQLDARLLREFAAAPRKQLQNILPALLPARLAEVFPALCGVSAIKQPAQITAAERSTNCIRAAIPALNRYRHAGHGRGDRSPAAAYRYERLCLPP